MITALSELRNYVHATTSPGRKGEVVTVEGNVTTVDNFPALEDEKLIDVFFINVLVNTEKLVLLAVDFRDLLIQVIQEKGGEFGHMTLDELEGGPSYIQWGRWLGDQTTALRCMALGQHYGLWSVVTPTTLGITGEDAQRLAGMGMVMTTPLRSLGVTDDRG